MADKTTTLKTKTNDNVYPNVIGDNRDNAIVDSAHINHTLTKEHKINFRLDSNVSNLIFNSLQKSAGLTKTKLVGVGTNGQENIEIGDNLTLANGKLSASGGGVVKIIAHTKSVAFQLEAKAYNSGDIGGYSTFDVASDLVPVARNSIYKENDCVFLIQPILKKENVSNEWRIALVCIVGGTISAPSTFSAKLNTFSLTQS